jgi:hypothetical protein
MIVSCVGTKARVAAVEPIPALNVIGMESPAIVVERSVVSSEHATIIIDTIINSTVCMLQVMFIDIFMLLSFYSAIGIKDNPQ